MDWVGFDWVRYVGIYTPFVINLDIKLQIDDQFYLLMSVGDRMALGIGYGLHNVCYISIYLFIYLFVLNCNY